MIHAVLFDMGGTLEDIYNDNQTMKIVIAELDRMLKGWGLDPKVSLDELEEKVRAGWKRYGAYRDKTDVECKPSVIWCDYILTDFAFPREALEPHTEEIAHMWELTHYHRVCRPRVKEMLEGLKGMGLKLGIISNTASLFQVFDSLEEYGIRDYFSDVTLSSVTGLRKPCGDIFTVAMRQLQVTPEHCAYVGDTISRDVVGSKKAGFHTAIQISSMLTREKDQNKQYAYAPDYLIEDIYDVFPIIKKINEEA